jgi:hypothetical protein
MAARCPRRRVVRGAPPGRAAVYAEHKVCYNLCMNEKRAITRQHEYSDAQVTEALVTLALCKHDYKLASEKTGISPKQLQRWNESRRPRTVPELLEWTLAQVLMRVPDDWNGRDWAVAVGILLDKWLLLQGQATERSEMLVRDVALLTEAERMELLAEANRILERTASRGVADRAAEPSTED